MTLMWLLSAKRSRSRTRDRSVSNITKTRSLSISVCGMNNNTRVCISSPLLCQNFHKQSHLGRETKSPILRGNKGYQGVNLDDAADNVVHDPVTLQETTPGV